ncbi:Transthyretin-like family protein [Ancylostoma caninum]|uniref:Transthyretin-like family protein n=1 Tax=Ancylostoma caninum TaxID=29170 RepID=A0A368GII1_ANCCA|nr:Transthyretin-like family protein [Ancylostoma caninum]
MQMMFQMQMIIALIFIPSCYAILGIGKEQSVTAMGTLKCNRKPISGLEVKLYIKEMKFNRKLAQVITDRKGSFLLRASARKISKMKPHLVIHHNCNFEGPCRRKYTRKISSEYIGNGRSSPIFNLGTLDLDSFLREQTIDCLKWRDPSVPDYSA